MNDSRLRLLGVVVAALLAVALAAACGGEGGPVAVADPIAGADPTAGSIEGGGNLIIYSGRSKELIGPILERFEEETGIDVGVRYGNTAGLAALLMEEGSRSPADVYIAQDAGALGAVEDAGLFAALDGELLARVAPAFRSPAGRWVGLSGRARTIVYNTDRVDPSELPDSILGFTDPKWKGKIGWAPANGSFQAFVTALRLVHGDDAALAWLKGIKANDPIEYPANTPIVAAAGAGEIAVGFVNHYYLYRFLAEQGEGFKARNFYTAPGDVGTLINVAGAGILESSDEPAAALELLRFLLDDEAQRYFTEETFEYPLIAGVEANADLRSIAELQPVDLDLGRLEDLDRTLDLMRKAGVLP